MSLRILAALFLMLLTGCQSIPVATSSVAGQTRIDAKGIEQVWVPAGKFLMGTDEAAIPGLKAMNPPKFILGELASEYPQHEVRLTTGYWIDKYEVTNEAFGAFARDDGYRNRNYWSEAGWEWLGKQSVDRLPKPCLGNLPREAPGH